MQAILFKLYLFHFEWVYITAFKIQMLQKKRGENKNLPHISAPSDLFPLPRGKQHYQILVSAFRCASMHVLRSAPSA